MQLVYRIVLDECQEVRNVLSFNGIQASPYKGKMPIVALAVGPAQREAMNELTPYFCTESITKRYAKDELRAAQWLCIRAAWQQYEITNKEKAVLRPCEACFCNRRQIGSYKISGQIKKARKAFLTPPCENDLFVRDDARELLEHSDLKGFHFREIICNNKDSALQRFSQIVIENTLPPAMKYDANDFKEKYICKSCGTHYSIVKGSAILKMDQTIMEQADQDIYFSYEQFGATGFGRRKIISGRFYRLLAENGFGNDITVDDIVKLV